MNKETVIRCKISHYYNCMNHNVSLGTLKMFTEMNKPSLCALQTHNVKEMNKLLGALQAQLKMFTEMNKHVHYKHEVSCAL